ncbi:MAG: hypothetical protein JSV04_12445 [Candidatus Heimdallarchaeota archaeon]|nr:MAG: hypothetical protein JSV04_12445 [Candidatus Heimdallarchaeota archaeon]
MSQQEIQCPCGQYIEDYSKYLLLHLKKEMGEIDILCPNEFCYLRELGFLKFGIDESGEIDFDIGRFYAPYSTWNATRITEESTVKILKQHLIDITEKLVDWDKVKKGFIPKEKEEEKREKENSETEVST